MNRGKINNPQRAGQLRDFTGLRYPGGITPTDVDAAIEIDDKLFCFIEYKFGQTPMPYGQKLFLERLVDALESGPRYAIAIEAQHSQPPDVPIDCANAKVIGYRWKSQWHDASKQNKTVKTVVDSVYEYVFHHPF